MRQNKQRSLRLPFRASLNFPSEEHLARGSFSILGDGKRETARFKVRARRTRQEETGAHQHRATEQDKERPIGDRCSLFPCRAPALRVLLDRGWRRAGRLERTARDRGLYKSARRPARVRRLPVILRGPLARCNDGSSGRLGARLFSRRRPMPS